AGRWQSGKLRDRRKNKVPGEDEQREQGRQWEQASTWGFDGELSRTALSRTGSRGDGEQAST
ncbi:MAG: hypothetical protein AAGC54_02220, partial [Cyanobacteria bacterium P01_F01_bin.4]